jgi:hypothetical protein
MAILRKFVLAVLIAFLFLFSVEWDNVSAAEREFPYTLSIDGEIIEFTQSNRPIILNGTAIVPFRPIFEKLGLKVTWNSSKKQIQGVSDIIKISFTIGSKKADVNGKEILIPIAPQLRNGTTYIPLRTVAESSGGQLILYGEEGGNNAWFLSAKQVGLFKAIGNEDKVMVEHFLKLGADPTVGIGPLGPSEYSITLYLNDDVEIIALYLKYGMDINYQEGFTKTTILHDAVFHGRVSSVRYLLEHGADPTIDSWLGTPLEIAQGPTFPEYSQNNDVIIELLESYLAEQEVS